MLKKFGIREIASLALVLLSAVILVAATDISRSPGDSGVAARHVEKKLNARMKALDGYAAKALDEDPAAWMDLPTLPDYMVVYRYVADSLQSWHHQFPIGNDDISSRYLFQRLINPRSELESPLSGIGPTAVFKDMGSRWFLVKAVTSGDVTVISGLDVMAASKEEMLTHKVVFLPLTASEGTAVDIEGVPTLKVARDSSSTNFVTAHTPLLWLALVLFMTGLLLLLSANRKTAVLLAVVPLFLIVSTGMYLWGRDMQDSSILFSPVLYADGPVLYSLGALILISLSILFCSTCVFCVRRSIIEKTGVMSSKKAAAIYNAVLLFSVAAILAYIHLSLTSVVMNSDICLELYKFRELTWPTAVVYVTYLMLFTALALLLYMLRPGLESLFGAKVDPLSPASRVIGAALFAIYVVLTTATLGFRKENSLMELWANRLSIDRDISLELQLRSAENAIADDALIASFAALGSESTILNRVSETYFARISMQYNIGVTLLSVSDPNPQAAAYIGERLSVGQPIYDGSRFMYSETAKGVTCYYALFSYSNQMYGITHVLLEVEPKDNREDRGYARLFGDAHPGRISLPSGYSHARYHERDLASSGGSFPYSTVMGGKTAWIVYEEGAGSYKLNGHTHFVNTISDDEVIIISRPCYSPAGYMVAAVFIALMAFVFLSIPVLGRKRPMTFEKNYYRSRVMVVLIVSLIVTLVAMAAVSVLFVHGRNKSDREAAMSDKISTLQGLVEARCRRAADFTDLGTQEFSASLEQISEMLKVDITLYSPGGKVFMSTSPELFERQIMGGRMDCDAFNNIVHQNKRYFIHREKVGGISYYAMYAPVFNSDGVMVAILDSPYTPQRYKFGEDAILHSATIIAVFILLLIFARLMTSAVVDRMFKPLVEMGRKMNAKNVDNLEYITYDRDDEITTLVQSYNRMVSDLSESTRQLAQAERDKAWSAMARQVAHEIKNPLTPMKLQLQRIIRLKAKGTADWQDKFDEMARVMLYHIDVLSDTANEFSTFAKLYSEEPSQIRLDSLIEEEMAMFDNKDNIEFTYLGLSGVTVMGPKPQLTRVFVNLIANAVQAVEIRQAEESGATGAPPRKGNIIISLRKSAREGYYDIVFEDDGPGVSEENQDKLFTPNFTTKNGGTGLGLAISRSILEKCGASISYSRSFTLGGACFTINYPYLCKE